MRNNSQLISLLIALIALSIGVGVAEAWLAQGFYHNDAHPGKCTISDTLIISPGETVKSPDDCATISCLSEDGLAQLTGCGSVAPPEGCNWGDYVDVHAPFQECCARHLICTDGMTNETREYEQHIWTMFGVKLAGVVDVKSD